MQSNVVRIARPQLAAAAVSEIKNSFKFRIKSFENGIKCHVFCDNSYWICHYFGVEINQLHHSLTQDYQSLRIQVINGTFLDDFVICKNEPDLYHDSNEEKEHFIKPMISENEMIEKMGPLPRSKYPLVVIVIRNDDDEGDELEDKDVVALINIIHIRDSMCQMETKILSQLLKQRNGRVFEMKEIFVADCAIDSNLCVICFTLPITRTILPCRHACVCGDCFEKIEKCPMCRCSILSFFKIHEQQNHNQSEQTQTEANETEAPANEGWFSSINRRVNNFLGFN